jgi:ERCC4-type nuclease
MVRLIVDVHEGEFLATISNADERTALSVGDFLLDTGTKETSWILERKTWGDGLTSWKSKRLQDQISRMVEEYDNYAVVVEGRPEDFFSSQEHDWKSFRSFLNRVSLETCPVIYTDTVTETMQVIHSLKKRIEEGTAHHFVRPVTVVKSSRNEHHNLLQSIPGIGREKAKKLYELYGSLSEVFTDWERAKDNKVVVAKTWEKVNSFMTEEWITKEPKPIRQREQTQSKLW